METLIRKLCCSGRANHPALHVRPPRPLASCFPVFKWPLSSLALASHMPTRARALSSESSQCSPIKAVPVQVAHELLNAGHRYLDVRTAEEFASGHIEGAVNIPYMYKVGPGLTKNLKFLEDVETKFGKDDEIVVGCQMGKRSQMAAEELVAAAYTGITDMAGGYMAWMRSGMPTETSV
ncbi:hypothetical protein GOP47_0013901 [Adiantum capillus-veneris]|uniref:Rhodanese domain-containing protein n=1 Tax=Adiantum capillus-veneris TaxID=13818 RepID=A0A9D4ZFU3_ADICA|nr:hypothetical protein GOP47_0013901 [Adiantum capillus-veneris]